MIGFKLSQQLVKCPCAWQKFIRHLQSHEWDDVSTKTINVELVDYNARYGFSGPDNCHQVEFKTEQDMILFILRWS